MLRTTLAVLLCSAAAYAQWGNQRGSGRGSEQTIRANIQGGGGDTGKCTAEVEVDGVAEVSISGDTGRIRTLSGSPSNWRRLDCNAPMPRNPVDFRFTGVDGRGRQTLVRDPRGGGAAVVRIEDDKGGREGYTFDLEWRGGDGGGWNNRGAGSDNNRRYGNNDGWDNNRRYGNNDGWDNNRSSGAGWNNGWGNNVTYNGRGRGQFQRQGGPNFRISGADVNISRNGRVSVLLDTDAGSDVLRFDGRIQRVEGDTIYADVRNAANRGDVGDASGVMRIQVRDNRRIQAISMDGSVSGRRFQLNWND